MFIYSHQVAAAATGGRTWTTREVVTVDVATNTPVAMFEFGGLDDFPIRAYAVPTGVVTATEAGVSLRTINGTLVRELYFAVDGRVDAAAPSRDGTLLAVTALDFRRCAPDCPPDWLDASVLILIDIATGQEVNRIARADPRFEGFPGFLARVLWQEDGLGVLVDGNTESERPGGLAVVTVEGAVVRRDTGGYPRVSPDGMFTTNGLGSLGCMFISTHDFSLISVDTGEVLATVADGQKAFTSIEWAPDSSGILVEVRDFPADAEEGGPDEDCDWASSEPELIFVPVNGSAPEPVEDRMELGRAWYGDRFAEFRCGEETNRDVSRWGELRDFYQGQGAVATLLVNGALVGEGHHMLAIGFIDRPASFALDDSGWPENVEGPLFLYSHRASSLCRTISIVDTRTQTNIATVEIPRRFLLDVILLRNDLLVVQPFSLNLLNLNGSLIGTVFQPKDGRRIITASVSPDSRMIAVATACSDCEPEPAWVVHLLDSTTYQTLVSAEPTAGGTPQIGTAVGSLTWVDDNSGVVLRGSVPQEGNGGLATLLRDGTLVARPAIPYAVPSPNGRLAVSGEWGSCHFGPYPDAFVKLVDIASGETLASHREDNGHFEPLAWSPDSRSYLFRRFEPTPPSDVDKDEQGSTTPPPQPCQGDPQWFTLTIGDDTATHVADPDEVLRSWYRERAVTYACPSRELTWYPSAAGQPWATYTDELGSLSPTIVYLGGILAGVGISPTPLRFLER